MPKTELDGLRDAAIPKKSWFGKRKDTYYEFLTHHGREVAEYEWPGYVLATLLAYLQEERQIDLMRSEFGDLSAFLTKQRGATHFIFTESHKRAYLAQLAAELFSEAQLRDYYNEFNETDEAEAGKPMLDGIGAIAQSLQSLEDGAVVVFIIG
ncbi:MAG: hypothetical protein HZB26_23830 [Candidatus Hydrogenedentes bacterium]|nr:hypothetical protein [Candidatus Hydrogenedentota bacterium]